MGVKRSIEWHEECLRNSKESLKRAKSALEAEIRWRTNAINATEEKIAEYEAQIELAKHERRKAFDAEKYGKRRLAAKIEEKGK